jgi:hypothetical protein
MFQEKFLDKMEKHILCSKHFLEESAVYEIMWKNMVKPDSPHMTI